MRVKLKDPRNHVSHFEYGQEYGIFFYATAGYVKFRHTRKRHVWIQDMGSDEQVSNNTKISKRELKQLLRAEDMVQWVVSLADEEEKEIETIEKRVVI